jgi:hypothetical protein
MAACPLTVNCSGAATQPPLDTKTARVVLSGFAITSVVERRENNFCSCAVVWLLSI